MGRLLMAISPINYTLNAADPATQVLQGAAMGQGLMQQAEQRGIAQDVNQRAQQAEGREQDLFPMQMQSAELGIRQAQLGLQAEAQRIQQAQEKLDRQSAFRAGWSDLVTRGTDATVEDFDRLNAQFPEMSKATMEYYEQLDDRRSRPLVSALAQAATAIKSGNVDAGLDVAREFADAARNAGDPQLAAMAEGAIKLAEVDPDAAYAQIGTLLRQVDSDLAGEVLGTSSGLKVQRSIPVGDGSAITLVMNDGTTKVLETNTNKVLSGSDADAAVSRALGGEVSQEAAVSGARKAATLGADIELGRAAAAEQAAGSVLGKARAEAQVNAQQTIASTKDSISLLQSVIDSPALDGVTGMLQGRIPARTQSQQDLLVKIGQIQGQAFLQAFESLKGGGAITEREGEAATKAIARLDRAQSPEEFRSALSELQGILKRAQAKAQGALESKDAGIVDQARRFGITTDDASFIAQMRQVKAQGKQLTPEQIQRLQQIKQKMAQQ